MAIVIEAGIPFDFLFSVLSFAFFGILSLYSLRTYIFFKESSLAHHLKIMSIGLALFTFAKAVEFSEYIWGVYHLQIVNVVWMLGALVMLFGILDFRREFLRFKWLKEIQDEIAVEKKRWRKNEKTD
ncbi:hypothetical protein KJ765_05895 [Candidatus Micrarchaeota archaeon]|nr:hypothetical protein [Candidatus Micrarchaeota archaeon]